jgi:AraC-like DNA-binding protein
MSTAAPAEGIHFFAPPYHALETRSTPCWPDVTRLRGHAVVWTLGDGARQQHELALLRERPPALPLIVLRLPADQIRRALPVLGAVPTLDARSVLPGAALGSPDRLRLALATRPGALPDAVARFLVRRGLLRSERLRKEVVRILELAHDTSSIARLSRRMYMSRRTLGRHFAQAGLPVPSHWLQFGRLLNVVVHLQSESSAIFRVATRLGYPDGFTMSNQMFRLIGCRPSEVRRLLGWEWVVEAWLRQEARAGGLDATRYEFM